MFGSEAYYFLPYSKYGCRVVPSAFLSHITHEVLEVVIASRSASASHSIPHSVEELTVSAV